ncbi:MAG: GNAT family N-acetyltransferase [Patescibacteria group bacterium]|nr:GNAT family N-acetyltransferase [Patescibacteria group bacterium]
MKSVFIRKAIRRDIPAISGITLVNEKTMLFRSPAVLRKLLNNYFTAFSETGELIGCCGFKVYSGGDAEIISLAVEKKYRGGGLGGKLIRRTIREARRRKSVKRVMAFANPSAFPLFKKNKFIEAGVQLFHEKILVECRNCPRNKMKNGRYQCNETAMVYVGRKS